MKFLKVFALIVLLQLPLLAHAKVEVNSFKSPNAPTEPYKTIVVSINAPLNEKLKIEKKVIKSFSKLSSTKFIPETQILPPVGEYTPELIRSVFEKNGVQAVLISGLMTSETKYSTYLAPTSSYTTGNFDGKSFNATTQGAQLAVASRDYTTHKINLFDLAQGANIWSAEAAASSGPGILFQKWTESSLISKTVNQISQSGLIQPK